MGSEKEEKNSKKNSKKTKQTKKQPTTQLVKFADKKSGYKKVIKS